MRGSPKRAVVVRHQASMLGGRVIPVLLAALFGLGPAAAPAQDAPAAPSTPEQLAQQHVQNVKRLAELRAGAEFLAAETARLKSGRGSFSGTVFGGDDAQKLDPELRKLFAQLLSSNTDAFAGRVEAAQAEIAKTSAALEKEWAGAAKPTAKDVPGVRVDLQNRRQELYDAAHTQGAAQLAEVFSGANRWVWVCSVIAVLGLGLTYGHFYRHEFRRMSNIRRGQWRMAALLAFVSIAIPTAAAIVTFALGSQLQASLIGPQKDPPRELFEKELADQQAELTAAEGELATAKQAWQAEHDRWKKLLEPAGEPQLAESWSSFRGGLLTLWQSLAVEKALAEGLKDDVATLQTLKEERVAQQASITRLHTLRRMTRGGLGLFLFSLTAICGLVLLRNVGKRERETLDTCPRCLAVGSLQEVESVDGGGLIELRCGNVIREKPLREECEFSFDSSYRDRPKKAFSTLGVSSSGKTHWLAMVYRELNHGRYPEGVEFERVKSQGAKAFDQIVELIIKDRLNPTGTHGGLLPHPLIFSFRDRDPYGKSSVLINTFDYAGTIMQGRGLDDFHRRRALDSDGFFFFLDPTQPSDYQADALVSFREDLKIVKKLKPGQRFHSPVALCVTKIDLLIKQPWAEGLDLLNDFYAELDKIENETPPMSLARIERRSDLIKGYREIIWPGWNIEQQIEKLFGGRCMFFPLTPVGLGELGKEALSDREQAIEPFAILDPLMWLLDMNGYPVLKD